MSCFPMAILIEGKKSLRLITEPKELPVGLSFRVILTQVTVDDFTVADEAVKNVLATTEVVPN